MAEVTWETSGASGSPRVHVGELMTGAEQVGQPGEQVVALDDADLEARMPSSRATSKILRAAGLRIEAAGVGDHPDAASPPAAAARGG